MADHDHPVNSGTGAKTGPARPSSILQLPEAFRPPTALDISWCRLRPLAVEHAERDYAAVMETAERLRRSSGNGWPREGFTLAENVADLRQHEDEFNQGLGFAYTVLGPDEREVLGCVYLNPPADKAADVDVHMWVREREYPGGRALLLHRAVHEWLESAWPFRRVRYLRPDYYFARGGCLCGAVSYYAGPVTGPFELCHCTRCRRVTGSAFAAGVVVGEVRFTAGADQVRVVELPVRESPPPYRHTFCGRCGSPVPDPNTSAGQEIAAGGLEQLPVTPDRHIFTEHTASWAWTDDGLPRLTGAEIHALRARDGLDG